MSEEIPTIEPYRELWKREEQDNKELREEIERLQSIIKEVREYIKENVNQYTQPKKYNELIEILDKVEENK